MTSEQTLSALRGRTFYRDCFGIPVIPAVSFRHDLHDFAFWYRANDYRSLPPEWYDLVEANNGLDCEIAFEVYDDE